MAPTRSALAMMDRLGLTAPLNEKRAIDDGQTIDFMRAAIGIQGSGRRIAAEPYSAALMGGAAADDDVVIVFITCHKA